VSGEFHADLLDVSYCEPQDQSPDHAQDELEIAIDDVSITENQCQDQAFHLPSESRSRTFRTNVRKDYSGAFDEL
jgi:hypothetical protein